MKEENIKYLRENFPNLYKEYGGDPAKTCMAWGIAVGDGWFELIKELSEKLEPLGIVAAQVKEKFGGLRFYVDGATEENWTEVHNMIHEAEEKSYTICERCGKPGSIRGGGWVRTLCDDCENCE